MIVGDFEVWGWNSGQVDLSGDLALTIPVIAGMILIAEGLVIKTQYDEICFTEFDGYGIGACEQLYLRPSGFGCCRLFS